MVRVTYIPRHLLIGLVRLYQVLLSPWLGHQCRFTPSCSHYAIAALREYGALRGSMLAAWRILRCNPWGGHGYDPPRWFGEPRAVEPSTEDHGLSGPSRAPESC